MEFNLKKLEESGGFVDVLPVPKEITWKHVDKATGETVEDVFTVYIKRQSFGAIEQIWTGDKDRSKSAAYIAASVLLGEGGKEKITYHQAFQLDPALATALIVAVNEVNGTGKVEAKNSQPPTSSGTTSSPTESAAEQ